MYILLSENCTDMRHMFDVDISSVDRVPTMQRYRSYEFVHLASKWISFCLSEAATIKANNNILSVMFALQLT